MNKRPLNFCTLFNVHYLSRGIALIESLDKHIENFHIYVFAFDDTTEKVISSLYKKRVTVIHLSDFENNDLLTVKKVRSLAEYCWTCTPAIIKYSIQKFNLNHCTYLDADIYFFQNPSFLIEEVTKNKKDVLITPHNYTPIYDRTDKSGKFCVQFMYFNDTHESMTVLKNWYKDCINWCYDRYEDGKFGDQMYLDSWPSIYKNIHITKSEGCLGPWNINRYRNVNPVFYHFHGFKILANGKSFYGWYNVPKSSIKKIYTPYKNEINRIERMLNDKFGISIEHPKMLYNLSYLKSFLRALFIKFFLLKERML